MSQQIQTISSPVILQIRTEGVAKFDRALLSKCTETHDVSLRMLNVETDHTKQGPTCCNKNLNCIF